MTNLFEPITLGGLALRNRLMRSPTAERVADPTTGAPSPKQRAIYEALARGGIGLIVTGHAYVARSGKAHPEMASIESDDLIPAWRETVRPAQELGARVIMQVNFGGSSCDPAVTPHPISPSGVVTNPQVAPRAMTENEIAQVIAAFGQAARRAREAGLDGVQIHGAHGYLVTQFLSSGLNQRDDAWGGSPEKRLAFLRQVVAAMQNAAGADYPIWIKLGVSGAAQHGLTLPEGATVAAACAQMDIAAIEISHAMGEPEERDTSFEAPYLPLAHAVRQVVGPDYPLALVNGFRTRPAMESVLASGAAQIISLCRPLILEPDLPNKLRDNPTYEPACVRCSRCWPDAPGKGSACYNPKFAKGKR